MAELVDAHDSKSCVLGHVGSIPTLGTEKGFFGSLFFIPKNLIPQGHQLRCHHNVLCHRKAYFNKVESYIVILQYTNIQWGPRNQIYSIKNKTKQLRC